MEWTRPLAAALTATLAEAGRHRVTFDNARRRVWNRLQREMQRSRGEPKPNRHARRAAARKKAAA